MVIHMTNYFCNKCGKLFIIFNFNSDMNIRYSNQFHFLPIKFRYGSKHDMKKGRVIICEKCLISFIESFKIPLKLEDYILKLRKYRKG